MKKSKEVKNWQDLKIILLHLTLFGVGGMLIGCGGYLAKLK